MSVSSPQGPVAAGSPHALWVPLAWEAVRLEDSGHLGSWQVTASGGTIEHCVQRMADAGVLDNLRRVTGAATGDHRGPLFADSDLYKRGHRRRVTGRCPG